MLSIGPLLLLAAPFLAPFVTAQCAQYHCPPTTQPRSDTQGGYPLSSVNANRDGNVICVYDTYYSGRTDTNQAYSGGGPWLCFYDTATTKLSGCHYPGYISTIGDERAYPNLICDACSPGYGYDTSNPDQCDSCSAGQFSAGGTDACVTCSSGSGSLDQAAACEPVETDTITESEIVEITRTSSVQQTALATLTSTSTPPAVTITQTVTVQNGISVVGGQATSTSTQAVPDASTTQTVTVTRSGTAACTNYILSFPAACCPNSFVSMQRKPSVKRRTLTSFNTITETSTSISTVLVPGSTVTQIDSTQIVTLPTPTSTVTQTVTQPSATSTSTRTQFVTVFGSASTKTIINSVTVQPTKCATQTIYNQQQCPKDKIALAIVQNVQKASLDMYKRLGGKSIVVDCGSGGQFVY